MTTIRLRSWRTLAVALGFLLLGASGACHATNNETVFEGRYYRADVDTDPSDKTVYVVSGRVWDAKVTAGSSLDEAAVESLALEVEGSDKVKRRKLQTPALNVSLPASELLIVHVQDQGLVTLRVKPKSDGERFTLSLR